LQCYNSIYIITFGLVLAINKDPKKRKNMTTKSFDPSNPGRTKPLAKTVPDFASDQQKPNSSETDYFETELRLTLEEIAHLHNALAEANMKLAAIQKDKSAFFTNQNNSQPSVTELLDELNPLLTTVANYTDLLASQSVGPLGPLQVRFVERITHSVEQTQQILMDYKNALLSLKSQPNDKGNHLSLQEVIQETITKKNDQLQKKQITLQLSISSTVPEVMGSMEDIAKIMESLLGNALEVTPTQEIVKFSLALENVNQNNMVVLSCSDHGTGIPDKLLPNLFSIHGDQHIPGCSLLRTALVALNQLVQDQGGLLTVENSAESGSVFKISFLPVRS